MADEFSDYYADFLEGTYSCVDRLVLNGYFRLGCSPGGFRTWWRRLQGSDEDLDNAHLMRLAGRFSRRVRAYAQANRIPIIDCKQGERKHELARDYLPPDPAFVGVFLILVSRAQAPLWNVQRSKKGLLVNLERKYGYVKHYSFHIIDPEWGHITIKLCGHPPFTAQIMLNGHEYVAQRAKQEGIAFTKEGNCFTAVADPAQLAQVADTVCSLDTIGRLLQVCERWIYSACLCFALSQAEQTQSGFHYDYSVYQAEYSHNLLFARGSTMEQVFQGVVDRTRARLDVQKVRTIFGCKKRPARRRGQAPPREEVVVERPTYDLTVFKVHFGPLTVKMYTKGEHVLRLEVIVHNARALPGSRSLPNLPQLVARLQEILRRFMDALHWVDVAGLDDQNWESLPTPAQVGQTRVGGVDLNKPRMRAVIAAVIPLAAAPRGFRAADLATKVRPILGVAADGYTARQAAYDLKKLRGKNIVQPIAHSRRYEAVAEGLRAVVAMLVLRDKVIKPVLAGVSKPKRGPKPKNQSPIDAHYEAIQLQMRELFQIVGIAA